MSYAAVAGGRAFRNGTFVGNSLLKHKSTKSFEWMRDQITTPLFPELLRMSSTGLAGHLS